jgi:hypothetical protein
MQQPVAFAPPPQSDGGHCVRTWLVLRDARCILRRCMSPLHVAPLRGALHAVSLRSRVCSGRCGLAGMNVDLSDGLYNMTDCCNQHDVCYDTCNARPCRRPCRWEHRHCSVLSYQCRPKPRFVHTHKSRSARLGCSAHRCRCCSEEELRRRFRAVHAGSLYRTIPIVVAGSAPLPSAESVVCCDAPPALAGAVRWRRRQARVQGHRDDVQERGSDARPVQPTTRRRPTQHDARHAARRVATAPLQPRRATHGAGPRGASPASATVQPRLRRS